MPRVHSNLVCPILLTFVRSVSDTSGIDITSAARFSLSDHSTLQLNRDQKNMHILTPSQLSHILGGWVGWGWGGYNVREAVQSFPLIEIRGILGLSLMSYERFDAFTNRPGISLRGFKTTTTTTAATGGGGALDFERSHPTISHIFNN